MVFSVLVVVLHLLAEALQVAGSLLVQEEVDQVSPLEGPREEAEVAVGSPSTTCTDPYLSQ